MVSPTPTNSEPSQQEIYNAIVERNELLDRLSQVLTDNTRELQRTQTLLDRRPPGSEQEFKRRRISVGLLVVIVLVIWGHDEHVEKCGPGARSEHAIEALLRDEPRQGVEAVAKGAGQPKFCDVTFPLHDHDGNGWPAAFNVLGLLAYLGMFTALGAWLLDGYGKMKQERRLEAVRSPTARTRKED